MRVLPGDDATEFQLYIGSTEGVGDGAGFMNVTGGGSAIGFPEVFVGSISSGTGDASGSVMIDDGDLTNNLQHQGSLLQIGVSDTIGKATGSVEVNGNVIGYNGVTVGRSTDAGVGDATLTVRDGLMVVEGPLDIATLGRDATGTASGVVTLDRARIDQSDGSDLLGHRGEAGVPHPWHHARRRDWGRGPVRGG